MNNNLTQYLKALIMNKLILATVLTSAALAGCGSGGSSSSSSSSGSSNASVAYKWQIVQLESVTEGDVKSGCVIYANSESNNGEVITANVAKSGYNILYHNADGSIASTTSSDDITKGAVTIAKNDVPDGGYVSLEEVDRLISKSADVYMFSVQKSLLTNLVLNVRHPQSGGCYAGDDYREETISKSAVVSVEQEEYIKYYQTSYDNSSVSGHTLSSKIPVASPIVATLDTLVTAFASYDTGSTQKTNLAYWGFFDSDYIYDSEVQGAINLAVLSSVDLNDLYWSTSDDVSLDSNSAVIAMHDSISYFWQPIYNDSDTLTIASGNAEVSQWSGYFSGKENNYNWLFENYISLNSYNAGDLISLDVPALSNVDGITITQTCTDSGADFCLDTKSSFSTDDFTLQRTQIQMTNTGSILNNVIYQSIYAEPSANPVVLGNSQFDIAIPTLTRIEINLTKSDATTSNALNYLMAQSMDVMGIAEKSSVVEKFSDANGFVATAAKSDELHKAMLASTTMTVKNAHDFN
jgi:hypothetical protein